MNALKSLAVVLTLAILAGCETAPKTREAKASLEQSAASAMTRFKRIDPALDGLLDRSHGHAVFPDIGKGAVGVGGAYGKGVVFEKGAQAGYADMTQATVGLQLGGQTYAELVVFETAQSFDRFKNNQLAFSANASAVAIEKGTSTTARFSDGVLVLTMPNKGAMFEASIGGQKFTYSATGGSGQPATRPASSERKSVTID